jgi:two-component system response regulator AtoC
VQPGMVEKAIVLATGDYLSPESFPQIVEPDRPLESTGMKKIVNTTERAMIVEALVQNGWVQTRAASTLGISERMLRYKMKKLNIQGA